MDEGERQMTKKLTKILLLGLVLAIALAGCNLIEVNVRMQADEDIAKIQESNEKLVAAYTGGQVSVGDVLGEFSSTYNETAYMYYYYFGYEMTESDVVSLMQDVLQNHVRHEVVAAKFDESNALTDEELTEVETDAQTQYDEAIQSALESAEGKNDEEKNIRAEVMLYEVGRNYDAIHTSLLLNKKYDRMTERLRDEVAEVSDDELQAAYDAQVAEDQANYTDGSSFENAMTGDDAIICWRPDGYRTVKHILVMPSDDAKTAYQNAASALRSAQSQLTSLNSELEGLTGEAEGERTPEAVQADIDAVQATLPELETALKAAEDVCLNDVKATTDEIYARLEGGESFEALIEEYGEDPGMQNEPTKTRGYYVSAGSTNWETSFRDAAMALENVGDYTLTPVVSGSGVHIIEYVSDVQGGEVALDEVRDALYERTLEELKESHATDTIDGWVAELNPVYDINALQAAVMG